MPVSSNAAVVVSPPGLQWTASEASLIGDGTVAPPFKGRRTLKRSLSNMSDAELASMPYIRKRLRLRFKQRPPLAYQLPFSCCAKGIPSYNCPTSFVDSVAFKGHF